MLSSPDADSGREAAFSMLAGGQQGITKSSLRRASRRLGCRKMTDRSVIYVIYRIRQDLDI